jgi:hypothetical protein
MTTLAGTDIRRAYPAGLAGFIDRWIFVFTAALFVIVTLVGFVPSSLAKIEAVQAGQRLPFPVILHVHAVLMGAWLLLLLAQTTLMATGQPRFHKQLGVASFVLAPALVIVGFLLVPTMRAERADAILHGPADVAERLRPGFDFALNIMLVQFRIGIAFAVLIALGLWARRQHSALHKRLMILGTVSALPAALDRITWLPSTLPGDPLTTSLYPLALIAPMFIWDLSQTKTVHTAYLIFLGLTLALSIPVHLLWGTPWWRETALQILGISGL